MDATLSYGTPRLNKSGTLLEGISLWGELLEEATVEEMVDRGLAYCDWAVSMGLLAIRSHVDTTADHLRTVEAMLEVREQVKGYLDLQLVAFPQDGFFRASNGRENLLRALDMGLDVVGGFLILNGQWRMVEDQSRSCAVSLPIEVCWWTCTVMRATIQCHAMWSHSQRKPLLWPAGESSGQSPDFDAFNG